MGILQGGARQDIIVGARKTHSSMCNDLDRASEITHGWWGKSRNEVEFQDKKGGQGQRRYK